MNWFSADCRFLARCPYGHLIAAALIVPMISPAAAQTSKLSVRVVDQESALLPCRAWVIADGRRLFEPVAPSTCTPYRRDQSFSCDGEFEIELPVGEAVVHIERGKEYLPVDRTIVLRPGEENRVTVALQRWVDMTKEGWYSSDMHVHLGVDNPQVLRQLALADDVHLTPVFTYWLRGTEPEWQSSWPSWGTNGDERIDATHWITRSNIEIERIDRDAPPGATVGASFLYQLDRPVTAERYGEHFPSDAALCLAARAHSPRVIIDTDKPSWAETVIGAALGVYDTVQVCHNHYHRSQTIPGSHGMIGPIAPEDSNAIEDDGLFHRTNTLYYRFLNCGFRLSVSGGSAIGVMPVPMGYNRVYAQVDGDFSPRAFWNAIKLGRSFATSGPLLAMTVNDEQMGTTIERTSGDRSPLEVRVRVRSIDRLESLQLVQDGIVIQDEDLRERAPAPTLDIRRSWQVAPRRSGWLATRALFRAPDGTLRQAHGSPVYIMIDDEPIARVDDAAYMLRWIDRLEEVADDSSRFSEPGDRDRLLSVYRRAREVYEQIAK